MMWDFQTCTYLVEFIGTNNKTDIFAPLHFTLDGLKAHCQKRFGVTPQPDFPREHWGVDPAKLEAETSHIIFVNGLRDGWSSGGIEKNVSDTIVAVNLASGAHHVELRGHDACDAQDVIDGRRQIHGILAKWLEPWKILPYIQAVIK